MSALPEQSKGSQLLASLREGLANCAPVPWPGSETMVQLRPLSDQQFQECKARAGIRMKEIDIELSVYSMNDFEIEIHIQALALSLHDVDSGERLFASAADLRSKIQPIERESLVGDFLQLQDRSNPQEMPEEQYNEISELIKKKDQVALSALGSLKLAGYLISTENQRLSSLTSSSSKQTSGNGASTDALT